MAAKCWPILISAVVGMGPVAVAQTPLPEASVMPTAGGPCEPRFYFDYPQPWLHGYIQEVPTYSGFHSFRPYNYKHVFSQSQVAAGWGTAPTSPYSQQYWNRDRPAQANAEVVPSPSSVNVPGATFQSVPARR